MSFEHAVAFVLVREGPDLVDDPDDPGGLSRYGIALRFHPELTADDIRNMTASGATDIYRRSYWPVIHGDDLPDYLHLPTLDCCVNPGQGVVVRLLQKAVGVPQDGLIGPGTLTALRIANQYTLLERFTAARINYWSTRSGWAKYGEGWSARAVAAALEAFS